MRAYKEAMDAAALSRQHYETVKMEATVKAFVEGSKKKADVQKFISEEARQNALREKEERERLKIQREHRICATAVVLASISILLALYFVVLHR